MNNINRFISSRFSRSEKEDLFFHNPPITCHTCRKPKIKDRINLDDLSPDHRNLVCACPPHGPHALPHDPHHAPPPPHGPHLAAVPGFVIIPGPAVAILALPPVPQPAPGLAYGANFVTRAELNQHLNDFNNLNQNLKNLTQNIKNLNQNVNK